MVVPLGDVASLADKELDLVTAGVEAIDGIGPVRQRRCGIDKDAGGGVKGARINARQGGAEVIFYGPGDLPPRL